MRTARDEFLSPQEAGDRLGVSVYTVRRWIQDGRIPAYKPGKEYRIRESDLEEFLRTREVRPKDPAPSPLERSFNDVLAEERRADWSAAVADARRLRERGRAKMAELLAAWRASMERQEAAEERRGYLDEMGDLLQRAYDARITIGNAMSGTHIADQWPELIKADRFYIELWHLVQDAGLSIRKDGAEASSDQAQPEPRPQAVEEPAVA